MHKNNRPFGVSHHPDLLEEIDKKRGDVNRSRYISRILEIHIVSTKNKKISNKKRGLSFAKGSEEHCAD